MQLTQTLAQRSIMLKHGAPLLTNTRHRLRNGDIAIGYAPLETLTLRHFCPMDTQLQCLPQ